MRIRVCALCAAVALCLSVSSCAGQKTASPAIPAVTPEPLPTDAAPVSFEPTAAPESPAPTPVTAETVSPTPTATPEAVTESFPAGQEKNPGPSKEAQGFVLVGEAVPDAILEIRYYSTYNFVGERIDGYEEPVALLTREAAAALREVSDHVMEQGYRLKIYDAYRPQDAVSHFARWAEDLEDVRMQSVFYPEKDKSVLFDEGYIARRSGHSRGSTVDLTLFDMETGKEVDMGGVFDYFGSRSHPDYRGDLTQAQIDARDLLRKVMEEHGFQSISTEWWHFTLAEEPYPNTYFNFPVSERSVRG